jgi:Xaa-Pro aminopeptidase
VIHQSRFQSFTSPAEPEKSASRIKALRAALKKAGLDGLLIPRADIFQGEYIPDCENRVLFLTGFTGSAGFCIILPDQVGLIVDGRYTLQAAAEVNRKIVTPVKLAEFSPEGWLKHAAMAGQKIGYNADLFTSRGLERFEKAAKAANLTLHAMAEDLILPLWESRPPAPATPVMDHPIRFAGEDAAEKITRVQADLTKAGLGALLVSECPNVNWLLNIRAGDVPHLPILRAFALVPATGKPSLYVDPARLDAGVAQRLSALCTIIPPRLAPHDGAGEVEVDMVRLAKTGARIRLDEESASVRFAHAIAAAGGITDHGKDPVMLMKAQKKAVECAGTRAAHIRDGAAMVRFLCWLDHTLPQRDLTEIDAVVALEGFRIATGELVDISFDSIAGAGPNAAIPHYHVSQGSNRRITPGLFLIDSGGNYRDGTTDITRTIQVNRATRAMREAFTRVLKGMIAISLAVFPKGTSGAQIDALARLALWEAGQDYDHGTGHGVGSFLSVHEGPQRLSKLGTQTLLPGMILSNEPGYYREGKFGIRIENLIIVEPRAIAGAEREMLGFETITLAPIDRRLILKAMLTKRERDWLNAYHARVEATLAPLLADAAEREWLKTACAKL